MARLCSRMGCYPAGARCVRVDLRARQSVLCLGSLKKRSDNKLSEVKAILENMGAVTVVENMLGSRFTKLLINSCFQRYVGGYGLTFGEAAKEKASRSCIQGIIKECIEVAKAARNYYRTGAG